MRIWNLPVIDLIPFDELEEERPVALVTTLEDWNAVKDDLDHLNIVWRADAVDPIVQQWANLTMDLQQSNLNDAELAIYAVGGEIEVDAAKYIAHHTGLELTCLPTALSADSFLTYTSSARDQGSVTHLETKPPERLIIDVDVLAVAPEDLRAAGICDLVSIATALWDWELAAEEGQNPEGMELIPWVADAAQAILDGALECAEAAGAGDAEGLKQLLDCLALGVQLCNQIDHTRPLEGSEHYFAYALENYLGKKRIPHAHLVGTGILLMAEFQDQYTEHLERALKLCHIPQDSVPEDAVGLALRGLPEYVRKHAFPYSIAHELKMQ